MATEMLKLYNRKSRELTVKGAFGDYRCRAGAMVIVNLNLGDAEVNSYMLIEKATHTFKHGEYRMDLTLDGVIGDAPVTNVSYSESNVVSDVVSDVPAANAPGDTPTDNKNTPNDGLAFGYAIKNVTVSFESLYGVEGDVTINYIDKTGSRKYYRWNGTDKSQTFTLPKTETLTIITECKYDTRFTSKSGGWKEKYRWRTDNGTEFIHYVTTSDKSASITVCFGVNVPI
jgi:hypothetical protein